MPHLISVGWMRHIAAPDSRLLRRTMAEFLERWTGAFSVPANDGSDPRLDYLLKKHVK